MFYEIINSLTIYFFDIFIEHYIWCFIFNEVSLITFFYFFLYICLNYYLYAHSSSLQKRQDRVALRPTIFNKIAIYFRNLYKA